MDSSSSDSSIIRWTTSFSSRSDLLYIPKTFGIYRSSNRNDLIISNSYRDHEPLNYVTIHPNFHTQGHVILHRGPSKSNSFLASARFDGWVGGAVITLGHDSRYGEDLSAILETKGFFRISYLFSLYVGVLANREKFEWRHSKGPKVRALGHSSGMELLSLKTNETVAVYAHCSCSLKKRGKMEFLIDEEDLEVRGVEFQLMAVMSLLAILESERRSQKNLDRIIRFISRRC